MTSQEGVVIFSHLQVVLANNGEFVLEYVIKPSASFITSTQIKACPPNNRASKSSNLQRRRKLGGTLVCHLLPTL